MIGTEARPGGPRDEGPPGPGRNPCVSSTLLLMRRRKGGRGKECRILATAGIVPLVLSAAGCLGMKDEPELDPSLTRYKGKGFSVG